MKTFKQLYTEKAPNTADAMKRFKAGKAGFTDKAHLKAGKAGDLQKLKILNTIL